MDAFAPANSSAAAGAAANQQRHAKKVRMQGIETSPLCLGTQHANHSSYAIFF